MAQRNNIIEQLKEFKRSVESDFPIKKMIFFGSRITGRSHHWSDIDLIIVSSKFRGLDFVRRGARMYDYWNLDYPVDFLCYSPEEFKRMSGRATIIREAVREGMEI
ncbi:MAG: nucleotidyltransferase domain-containing protein [Candidatus Aminicenantes bacterium]|jgi:predicted nucleotidyltransferase